MIKRTTALLILIILFSGSAIAYQCSADMSLIDSYLTKNPDISASDLAKAKELRALGEKQHKRGQHDDSIDTLAKALKILQN